MQKHLSFAITAAVLLTAIVTVTLYTANAANAQGNMTGAAKNMTNATGGAAKNMAGPGAAAINASLKGRGK